MMMVVIVMMSGVQYSTLTVQLYSTSKINWLPRTIIYSVGDFIFIVLAFILIFLS